MTHAPLWCIAGEHIHFWQHLKRVQRCQFHNKCMYFRWLKPMPLVSSAIYAKIRFQWYVMHAAHDMYRILTEELRFHKWSLLEERLREGLMPLSLRSAAIPSRSHTPNKGGIISKTLIHSVPKSRARPQSNWFKLRSCFFFHSITCGQRVECAVAEENWRTTKARKGRRHWNKIGGQKSCGQSVLFFCFFLLQNITSWH